MRVLPALVAATVLAGVRTTAPAGDALDVLVFTRAEGFVHDSIADGAAMMQALGGADGWNVTVTDDHADLDADGLAGIDVTVWISTTGDVLDAAQETAFRSWVEGGGGYVGIHAAADCEYSWPWYGTLLGGDAWFLQHPVIQEATLDVDTPGLVGTSPWPARFDFRDEWYDFRQNPRPSVDVLLTLDPSSYVGDVMGDDHPIAWSHIVGAGRSFYTGLGHRSQTYADARFREHIRQAVLWAAGRLVFTDGFEREDTGAWPASPPDSSPLPVPPEAPPPVETGAAP